MVAPKLRFQEFDGDWAKSKLGDEAQFFQGEQVSLDDQYSEYSSGLTKFLRIENFTQKSKDFRYIKYSGSPEKILTETDIAIVRYGATAGFICSGETGVIANNLFKASVDNTKINQKYLELVLKSEKTFNYFQTAMSGGAMPALNFKIVGNLDITYSSILEQTKIASFLSAVDEKISQLTQKHQLLSQYKQGMMQKLFSQQIRFKADDGSEFGEWEETILSDIVNLFHGYQFRTSDFTSKGIAVIKIGNVIGNNLDLANLTYVNENRLEDFKKFEILNGDILMSLTGNIGRIIEVKNKPFIILQNYRVGKFIPLNENFLIKPFLKYLLTSDLVFGRFSQLANQSAQANFGKQDMDKIAVFYPSVSEQTKIANFLSSIDQKIDVVSEQLEQAKLWKKGLLQQMFV